MLTGFQHPIYIATTPVDMRKAFDGLSAIVKNGFKKNPLDGTFFVFINRAADRLKILYWDRDGYALWYKRLEAGRFRIPIALTSEGEPVALISTAQLAMILEGIEPVVVKRQKRFTLKNTEQNRS
jgi:transposase